MKLKTFISVVWVLFATHLSAQKLTSEQFKDIKMQVSLENDKEKKADLLYRSALHYLNRDGEFEKDLDSGLFFIRQSLDLNRRLGLKRKIAQGMLLNARIEWEKGNSNRAISIKNSVLDYVLSNNFKLEEAEVYIYMGWGLAENATFPEKIDYFKKAISLYKEIGDVYEEGQTNFWVGYMFESMKHTDSAFNYFYKAIKLKKSLKTTVSMYEEYSALAFIFRKQANYQEALNYGLEAVKNAENVNASRETLTHLYNNLGETYNALKKVDKALAYYEKALEIARLTNDTGMVKIITTNHANTQRVKLEAEQKDENIQLLQQQTKLQEEVIHKAKLIRYFYLAGLVILGLFVTLFYNRSRIIQQANKNLEMQQQKNNEQNILLKKLLSEKEWLLKEIHHRVKNNLQVVISLLNTQSIYLKNKDALTAIKNSQNRMHAMSLIHQKLYQSDNMTVIDMHWYINELINYLKESYNLTKKISFHIAIESIKLDVTQAVPLGLILNEAITNSIKYAFQGKDKGEISILLKSMGGDIYDLTMKDDGIGLPEGFELQERESLGMDLMMGLAEQLDGVFQLKTSNGLSIIITFSKRMPLNAIKKIAVN